MPPPTPTRDVIAVSLSQNDKRMEISGLLCLVTIVVKGDLQNGALRVLRDYQRRI